jgi:tetratricopeptide (TPR) repeat protein
LTGYSYLGYSYDKLEKYQKAIDAYKKAIEIKPDLHYAYFNMGPAYFKYFGHVVIVFVVEYLSGSLGFSMFYYLN